MQQITIFTDGSSRGNPGPGGWGAVVVQDGNVKELGGRDDSTTNNRMELTAAIEALDSLSITKPIILYTDSSYMINGITKWVHGWARNNWITGAKQQVLNQNLWKDLMTVVEGKEIKWTYVAGHSGIPANERCDVIATAFADKKSIELYNGPLSAYSVDVKNLQGHLIGGAPKKSKNNAKAYSYLSMVNGDIQIHQSWAECEKRVKGVKAAKFKKSVNKEDESAIIQSWKS